MYKIRESEKSHNTFSLGELCPRTLRRYFIYYIVHRISYYKKKKMIFFSSFFFVHLCIHICNIKGERRPGVRAPTRSPGGPETSRGPVSCAIAVKIITQYHSIDRVVESDGRPCRIAENIN